MFADFDKMSPFAKKKEVLSITVRTKEMAMEEGTDISDMPMGSPGILGRAVKPDEEAKKRLNERITKTVRSMAADISKEVKLTLDAKYSVDNVEARRKERVREETERRRRVRDTRQVKNRRSRASRMERKSYQEKEKEEEREMYNRMNAEEKAAVRRKERRTLQERSGGLSEYVTPDDEKIKEAKVSWLRLDGA